MLMAHDRLSDLRLATAAISRGESGRKRGLFSLGFPAMDARLGGGLERAALHEIMADAIDGAAALGFAAALAARAIGPSGELVWIRQDSDGYEAGEVHGPGLAEFGLNPRRLSLLRLCAAADVLRAASEAARCASLCVAVLEIRTGRGQIDLTATRRLTLAAEKSGVTLFLLRTAARAVPSAATTRWSVRPSISRPLPGGAPGRPCFDVTLSRHRAGAAEKSWRVEWNREQRVFSQAVSGPVVPLPASRPAAAFHSAGGLRRAG